MSSAINLAQAILEKSKTKVLPQEAAEILAILNELENFTITMRKKIMEEIKSSGNSPKLVLQD
jgi:hypothetical protein